MVPRFKYRAFISYSHQDRSWADWLHKALESYRVPHRLVGMTTAVGVVPARLTPIFRDRDDLPSTTDLNSQVHEALNQSANLIVICSRHAVCSRWVNEEISAFKRLGRGDRILCMIVDAADDESDDRLDLAQCFPAALHAQAGTGGEQPAGYPEPIAADARPRADGKAHAKLKLVAGLLGVGFDALVQREQHRRYRRLLFVAAAAVLALAILSVFTTVTVMARRDAVRQRTHAEGLVEFMLGDLTRKLQPDGRLSALDAVGKEALAYYAAQKPGDLDADALARRARALHLIGQVYDLRGRLDEALSVFRQASDSTAELLARAPDEPQRIFDHAQSVYWVGYIAYQHGDFTAAERAFHQYQSLAGHLVAIDPGNAAWQAEVEYADSNLGTLLLDAGRAAEAATAFERSLRIATALASETPQDVQQQVDAAQAHGWLADALEEQGHFDEATSQRRVETDICQALLVKQASNAGATQSLVVARRALARLALVQGRTNDALKESQAAVDLADGLVRVDPANTFWAQLAADAHLDRGDVLHYHGNDAMARDEVDHARRLADALVATNASVLRWQVSLVARSELLRGTLDASTSAHARASTWASQALKRLSTVRETHPLDRVVLDLTASAQLLSGDELQALGHKVEAAQAWRAAVDLIDTRRRPLSPKAELTLAQASLRLGDTDRASEIASRLERIGYRHPEMVKLAAEEVAMSGRGGR